MQSAVANSNNLCGAVVHVKSCYARWQPVFQKQIVEHFKSSDLVNDVPHCRLVQQEKE